MPIGPKAVFQGLFFTPKLGSESNRNLESHLVQFSRQFANFNVASKSHWCSHNLISSFDRTFKL